MLTLFFSLTDFNDKATQVGASLFDLPAAEALVLTLLIEIPLFYLRGYRSRDKLGYFAVANIFSNVLLNEYLAQMPRVTLTGSAVLAGEMLVVAFEMAFMSCFIKQQWRKLFGTVLLTNLVSYAASFIYQFFL